MGNLPNGWGENDPIIVCVPVHQAKWHESNALVEKCDCCGEAIWAAPSSVEQGRKPGWHLVCNDCLNRVSEDEPVFIAGRITPANPYPWRVC